jgi:N utilization substance protein A
LVKHFLKINIPEIGSGIVEIKKIARVPGIKTKVAVVSNQPSVTIGSIIGNKGERINEISKNIGGERIDIIEYSDDLGRFVINACSPTHLVGYKISENGITVVVDESKVALLIGKRGADVKLLSILLGKPVSIISSTQANEEGLDYTPVDESVYYRPRNSKPTGSYETKKENTFSANFISDDEE